MPAKSAMEISFDEAVIFGKPALVTGFRVDRNSIPEGCHLYSIRHDDDGLGYPVQLAKDILVNHFMSVVTLDKLDIPASGYLDINDGDFNYCEDGYGCRTVEDFIEKYSEDSFEQDEYDRQDTDEGMQMGGI